MLPDRRPAVDLFPLEPKAAMSPPWFNIGRSRRPQGHDTKWDLQSQID
jgi:hypothetical protein